MQWGTTPAPALRGGHPGHDRRRLRGGRPRTAGRRRGRARWRRWATRSRGSSGGRCWGGGSRSPGPGPRPATSRPRCGTSAPRSWSCPSSASRRCRAGPEIDAACAALGDYDLVVLTSVNGVDALFARLAERGGDARRLRADATVVAIGPATAERLAAHGVRADVVPERFVAEGILDALSGHPLAGPARPGGAGPRGPPGPGGRPARPGRRGRRGGPLRHGGRAPGPGGDRGRAGLRLGDVHLVVDGPQLARAGGGPGPRPAAPGHGWCRSAPITSAALRDLGLPVHAEAREFTIPGLVAALLEDARP